MAGPIRSPVGVPDVVAPQGMALQGDALVVCREADRGGDLVHEVAVMDHQRTGRVGHMLGILSIQESLHLSGVEPTGVADALPPNPKAAASRRE